MTRPQSGTILLIWLTSFWALWSFNRTSIYKFQLAYFMSSIYSSRDKILNVKLQSQIWSQVLLSDKFQKRSTCHRELKWLRVINVWRSYMSSTTYNKENCQLEQNPVLHQLWSDIKEKRKSLYVLRIKYHSLYSLISSNPISARNEWNNRFLNWYSATVSEKSLGVSICEHGNMNVILIPFDRNEGSKQIKWVINLDSLYKYRWWLVYSDVRVKNEIWVHEKKNDGNLSSLLP